VHGVSWSFPRPLPSTTQTATRVRTGCNCSFVWLRHSSYAVCFGRHSSNVLSCAYNICEGITQHCLHARSESTFGSSRQSFLFWA
jgi:hypothetical protein